MADNDEAEIKPEETLDVKENLPGDGQTPVNHTDRRQWRYMLVSLHTTSIPHDIPRYPKVGDVCMIQYTASFASNGEQFDSSHDHAQTGEFEFTVGGGEVIRGLNDGIQRMTTGERATITMSSSLAYGYSGVPGLIPANADLVFEVWLISVNGCKNMV